MAYYENGIVFCPRVSAAEARRQMLARHEQEITQQREMFYREIQSRKKKRDEKKNSMVKQAASIPGNKGSQDVEYLVRYIEGSNGSGIKGGGKKSKVYDEKIRFTKSEKENYIHVPLFEDNMHETESVNDKCDKEEVRVMVNSNNNVIESDEDEFCDDAFVVVQSRKERRASKREQALKNLAENSRKMSGEYSIKGLTKRNLMAQVPNGTTSDSSSPKCYLMTRENISAPINIPVKKLETSFASSTGGFSDLSGSEASWYSRSRTSSAAFTSDDMESDDSENDVDFTLVTTRKQKKQLRKEAEAELLKDKYKKMTEAQHLITALKATKETLSERPEFLHLFSLEQHGHFETNLHVQNKNIVASDLPKTPKRESQERQQLEKVNILEDID